MSDIKQFLEKLTGAKEIGLCIMDSDSLSQVIDVITDEGFNFAQNINDFSGEGDYLFLINGYNAKFLYDFASEYGTGQVSYINEEGGRSWKTPVYEKTRIVFLADRSLIIELEKQNMDFLTVCGMTYQK